MADYHPLILRAVEGLEKNTGENRRALYERARTALVAQLRGVQPALEESEITRERLALEEAIRKVEAESARRAREEPRKPPPPRPPPLPRREERAAPPPPPPPQPSPGPADPSSWADLAHTAGPDHPEYRPETPSSSLTDEAVRGFRHAMDAPDAPRRRPPYSFEQQAQHYPQQDFGRHDTHQDSQYERQHDPRHDTHYERQHDARHDAQYEDQHDPRRQPAALEDQWTPPPEPAQPPSFEFSEPPPSTRPRRQRSQEPPEPRRPRQARAYGKYLIIAGIALAVILLGGVAWWQRDAIGAGIGSLIAMVSGDSKPAAPGTTTPQQRPKITDRLGGPQTQPSGAPAVGQRVVLYEEDPDDPQGKRLLGAAVWRTEMMAAAPGRPAELAVRADIEVPERRMTMTFTLRRNSDASLPASHTIEIMFNLPPDAPSGGVQNVPGVLMKQAEQTRGVPLAGLAVPVTPGYFLIGLSSLESDMQRNVQLLKERSWFDIPIIYNNNRRAILALEKGTPGEQAFNQAFATWKQ